MHDTDSGQASHTRSFVQPLPTNVQVYSKIPGSSPVSVNVWNYSVASPGPLNSILKLGVYQKWQILCFYPGDSQGTWSQPQPILSPQSLVMQNPFLNEGIFKWKAHKTLEINSHSAFDKSLWMPPALYICAHTHRQIPAPIFLHWGSPFPSSSMAFPATPSVLAILKQLCAMWSSQALLAPCNRSHKAITFTLIAGEKLEIDKFSLFMYCLNIALVVLPVTSS